MMSSRCRSAPRSTLLNTAMSMMFTGYKRNDVDNMSFNIALSTVFTRKKAHDVDSMLVSIAISTM